MLLVISRLKIVLVVVTVFLARPCGAEQRILLQEDFELGALPAGWTHYRGGPEDGDTGDDACSTVYFLEVGLGGLSMVLGSSDLGGTYPDGCHQATGVLAGPFDITGCEEMGFFGEFMDLHDESHHCPFSWEASEPPAGDCLGFSLDGNQVFMFAELVGYNALEVVDNHETVPVDDALTQIWFYMAQYGDYPPFDVNGDGWIDDGLALDNVVAICNPFEDECADGLDGDYDSFVDCDDSDCAERDEDEDSHLFCGDDCDDMDAAVFPGAEEVCDGKDNDCDGDPGQGEGDEDGDGFLECADDCDDQDPAVHPGAAEICDDGVDNDCDGAADDADPTCAGDDDDLADDDDTTPSTPGADDEPLSDGCSCTVDRARILPLASVAALVILLGSLARRRLHRT